MDAKPESDRSKDRPTMRSTRHTGFLPNVGGYSSPGDNSWYSDRARPLHSGPREPLAECRNEMEQPKEEAANRPVSPSTRAFGRHLEKAIHDCHTFAGLHAHTRHPFPPRSLLLAIRRRRSPLSRRIGRRLPDPVVYRLPCLVAPQHRPRPAIRSIAFNHAARNKLQSHLNP
jgi:hypothetical protein